MDSYRMNCRNVSGNCRNRTCGNMNLPVDFSSEQSSRNFVNHFVEKEADAGDDGTK